MYIEAEEKLLDKVGLLEYVAEDDVKGGEATRLGIESSVVILSGVFFGEGIPEAVELLLSHVEDVLHTLHGSVDVADKEKVADVEHRVAIPKAIQVNPIIIRSSLDEVACLEIAMHTVSILRDGFYKGSHLLSVPPTYKSGPLNGQ